jgi:hypothetical protein
MLNQFNASLWGDEAWAATLAVKPIREIIRIVARDTSPPLYYLFDHVWMGLFGTSEVSIRTLTFIFFLGTIFFVYLIGRHFWDEKTGLLAAALTFTNPFLFKYAFEGRMYALLGLTTTASMYFFLKKNRWGHILVTTAALYTHHFALFAIVAQFAWRIFENWGKSFKEIFKAVLDFLIIGLAYSPWLYPLYYQTSLVGSGFWLGRPTLKTLGDVISTFLLGFKKSPWEVAALLCLVLVLLRRDWAKDRRKSLFLVLWFVVPIGLTFAVSWIYSSIFFDRYMLFVIPGVLLLLSSGRRRLSFWFLAAFVGILLTINGRYFLNPTKRPFRDFSILVKEKIDNHDFLINYNAAAHHLFESKYYGIPAPLYVPEGELPYYVGTALMTEADIVKRIPMGVVRLGVITSGSIEEIKIPGFQLVTSFSIDNLKFARFAPNQ